MEVAAVPEKKKLKKMFSWTDDNVYVQSILYLVLDFFLHYKFL